MSLHDGARPRVLSAFPSASRDSGAAGESARQGSMRRRTVRRLVAAGAVGTAITASGLVGAVDATAAGPVVVDTCTEEAPSDSFGQPIVAGPEALDAKVEQAMLLAFPLDFDRANRARQQFLDTAPVSLGNVTEKEQDFSGTQLADALAPRVASLPAVDDRADSVNFHIRNLAAVGCISGVEVPGQAEPAPEPQPEPPADQPPADQGTSPQPPSQGSGVTGGDPSNTPSPETSEQRRPAPSGSSYTPGPAKRVTPPDYAYVPGSLPPWSTTRFGQTPGQNPAVGDLLAGERRTKQEQVRAAGSAEALPTNPGNRVALPVLIAAISIAGVTSALVRTWVLRRA